MSDADGKPSEPMRPDEALATMANMTRLTGALRARMEGLTLVIWGICMAASYLTIAVPILGGRERRPPFNDSLNGTFPHRAGPPPTEFFFNGLAPLVWFLIAAVVIIVLWRSMSLSFQTGVATERVVLVFGLILIVAAAGLTIDRVAGAPAGWHLLVWALVTAIFAFLNPLRFHPRSRWAVAAAAVVILLAGAYALVARLDPRDTTFLSGLALGLPMLVAGLYLMVAD